MSDASTPTQPVYRTTAPNEELLLATEEATLGAEDSGVTGTVQVRQRWLPKPRLAFSGDFLTPSEEWSWSQMLSLGPDTLRFPRQGLSTRVLITSRTDGNPISLSASPLESFVGMGGAGQLSRVVFHLLNHRPFMVRISGTRSYNTYVVLEADGWRVRLDPLRETQALNDALRESGGFAITHVGKLERVDGGQFSKDDAKQVLDSLHYFLSFARGMWAGPCLPLGYNQGGQVTWQEWGVPTVTPWEERASWFDPVSANVLPEAFPGYLRRWSDPEWKLPLRRAVFLYVVANMGEGGAHAIVLSQAALELLAWMVLVRDPTQPLTAEGFNGLRGGERLFQLLDLLGVPTQIPPILTALLQASGQEGWQHGPHAFVEVRNSLVHPRETAAGTTYSGEIRYEGWWLGQWYLELALLKLFGHTGVYANRMEPRRATGQVSPVPWAARSATP